MNRPEPLGAPSVRAVRTRDGVRLALEERGPVGPDVVLLVHGFSQNHAAFALGRLPDRLVEAGFRVALAELRGHGRSERPHRWTLEDHLFRDLPALLGALEADRIHYVGHSMGGMLGFASLGLDRGLASVTGLAAPLALGAGSPLVPLAARVVKPVAARARPARIPMDRLLGALAHPLGWEGAPLPVRVAQRVLGLASPGSGDGARVRTVLGVSDPESPAVFAQFLGQCGGRTTRLCGVDLSAAVRGASVPVAAVVGSHDIFAPPRSVGPLTQPGHAGPRRVVVLQGAAHVDLTVGARVAAAVVGLRRFWEVA